MDIMRYNFVAPAGKHFGIIKTIAQALAEIPNAVDYWTAGAANVTQANGTVTAWTGQNGRTLSQSALAKQPTLQGSEILMGDGAGSFKASLSLDGAAIGVVSALTIAGKVRLPASALTVDNQPMFGNQTGNIFRTAYRYAGGNNFIRTDMTLPTVKQIDRDIPDGMATIPVILVITGGVNLKVIVNDTMTEDVLPAAPDLQTWTVGAASVGATTWRGWVSKHGIWKTAANDAQIKTLKEWLAI